jgi:hypothetical protein
MVSSLYRLGCADFPRWSVNFLPLVEIFVNINDERAIIAAVRLLPQGLSAAAITLVLTFFPKLTSKPRWPIAFGTLLSLVALVLFTQASDLVGKGYWRWLFPGFIIGSGGMMAAFTGTNVGIMTSVPAEMAGVAGAVLQVSLQVGSAVALSIQAGLLTVAPGSISNFTNVTTSWYFELGWGIVWLVAFLVFYKPQKSQAGDLEGGEKKVVVAH